MSSHKNQTYDYVIIGAGSAGCVLANKLGADKSNSILVLEAGPMDRDLLIHVPAGVYKAWRDPKINWNYETDDEPSLDDRNIFIPRGKVVGGSSSINSMVYMRGNPQDFDRWESECGLKNWSYANCLPYFKAGETSDRGGDKWRGDSGPLGVSKGTYDNPLYDAFFEAGGQAGQGQTEDANGYQPEGVTRLDATRKNGRRCSAAVAHLRPALKRGNVTLLTRAMVQSVIIEGNQATGVSFDHKGQRHTAHAAKEVILSGGAINSPQLLMLSGIGPADHLLEHDIDVKVNLPGVGQNLQDHACALLTNSCLKSFPMHKIDQPLRKFAAGVQWVFTRSGAAASNIWESGGMIRGNDSVPYANIEYHFGPVGFEFVGTKMKLLQAFVLHIDQSRPRSRGQVRLSSANPYDKASIQQNLLSHPEDMKEMIEGVRKARELFAQPAFNGLSGIELDPGPDVQTDNDLRSWISATAETDFHPSCSCKMGHDDLAVVDDQMRVHGVEGLRVVDASVMPQITSANLNAPTQMIAARAADYILGKEQLAPVHARFAFQV
ncbi:choline dehydrogenase [Alphaproteobacteria bacterium]|nr:choline dehydrogenase [Alphaproteobacteria bacterium]